FRVAFGPSYVVPPECKMTTSVTVGSDTILHIRGRGGTGELVAPSPITLFRSALGINVGLQQRSANILENGVHGGLIVSFPTTTTPEQAKEFKEIYNADQSGPLKAGQTKVIGGGATLTQIGMSQQDAEFVDWANLSLLDISDIMSIP
ncbi:MAG: phage portal protein, partial [Candidatus Micrarchaeales archaeon]